MIQHKEMGERAMKKAVVLAVLLFFALCISVFALAEDPTPTYEIGTGSTEFLVIVTEAANMDMKIYVYVHTNQDNLMDALTKLDFISVEKASWGYYVSSVLDIKPTGNSYWGILEFNGNSYQDLSTPIQSTPLSSGNAYAFILY